MNVLALSFDHALLVEGNATQNESRHRQVAYAEELRHKAPGSRMWIVVRSAPGMTAKPVAIADNLELYPTSSSAIGFISAAYRHGRELCSRLGLDLITSQSPFSDGLVAWALRSRCKAKWLVQLHMSSLDNPHWLAQSRANWLRARLGKFLLLRADAVRVVSESASLWLQKRLGMPEERIFVVPVGTGLVAKLIPLSREHAASKTVLFVGRLSVEKGVPTLLHAFAHVQTAHHDARLVIVGDGPERTNLQELASALGLQDCVRFVGWTPYEQLPRFYANADVVVIPSLHESYGRVIVEAMSFGRATVATDTEGARSLIQDGRTGFVVPVQDIPALASKISDLLRNPQVANKVGQAARQLTKRTHDPQALCAAQVEMWLKMVGQ